MTRALADLWSVSQRALARKDAALRDAPARQGFAERRREQARDIAEFRRKQPVRPFGDQVGTSDDYRCQRRLLDRPADAQIDVESAWNIERNV